MDSIIKRAFIDSFVMALYVIIVVSFLLSLQAFSQKPDNVLIPVAMLLLFLCSATITGSLVFGKPVMLYIDGKKKDAVKLLGYTIGLLVLITVVVFACMIYYINA